MQHNCAYKMLLFEGVAVTSGCIFSGEAMLLSETETLARYTLGFIFKMYATESATRPTAVTNDNVYGTAHAYKENSNLLKYRENITV